LKIPFFAFFLLTLFFSISCVGKKKTSKNLPETFTEEVTIETRDTPVPPPHIPDAPIRTYSYTCTGRLMNENRSHRAENNDQSIYVTVSKKSSNEKQVLYANGTFEIRFEKEQGDIKIVTYKGAKVVGEIKTNIGTRFFDLFVLTQGMNAYTSCQLDKKLDLGSVKSLLKKFKCFGPSHDFDAVISEVQSRQEIMTDDQGIERTRMSSYQGRAGFETGEVYNMANIFAYSRVSMDASSFMYTLYAPLNSHWISCR